MYNTQEFLNLVEAYDTIYVYRHTNPDGDALGSQLGMTKWLRYNYPNKHVHTFGQDDHGFKIYDKMENPELADVFLAIVIDTANQDRIDSDTYLKAEKIIKIDHHLEVDQYGDLQIVDTTRGSACEIVADIFKACDLKMNDEIANTTLSGILTDTIRFSIENTSARTLMSAAFLLENGANISELNAKIFNRSLTFFEVRRTLQNLVQWNNAFAYAIVDKKTQDSLGITDRGAKDQVNMMSGIEEFAIWAIFAEKEDGRYTASLRSRSATVSDLANEYRGGGHRLACGIGDISFEEVQEIIAKLAEISQN